MTYRRTVFVAAVFSLTLGVWCDSTNAADAVPDYVTAAVSDRGRTPWDFQRDALRKPAEVLAFSQIKPGMVVVDLAPGDGYYTRILSALVGPKGKVYALVPFDGSGEETRAARMQQREGKPPSETPVDLPEACNLGCYPAGRPPYLLAVDEVLAIQNIAQYKNVTILWEELGSFGGNFAVPEQVDAVVSVNAYHELHEQTRPTLPEAVPGRPNKFKPLDMAAVDKSIYKSLKPGGVFLVADYASVKGAGFGASDTLHRTEADATKAEGTGAGFTFDGASDALASNSDDHSKPVTGVYATRDKTDQYLLRFKKPASAPAADKRPKDESAVMKSYYGNTMVVGTDLKNLDKVKGTRLRIVFYNEDHTYQEFGKVGEGAGPMQSGTWYWDAAGHNCQLHQFPIDERQSVVCHIDVVARPVGVVQNQNLSGGGAKVEIVKGNVLRGLVIPAATPAPPVANIANYVAAAVNDRGRTPWDVERDALRKPAEVLAFSDIKPGMVVAELSPDDGYYTRMLSKLVGPKGKIYAVVPPEGDGEAIRAARIQQREGKLPAFTPTDEAEACVMGCYPTGRPPYMLAVDEVLALQNISEYSNLTVLWEELAEYGGDLAVPEQVDAVFNADAYHELHTRQRPDLPEAVPGRPIKFKPLDMPAVNKSIFQTMKPGGVYLVTDYAAAKGAGFSVVDSLHRSEEEATKAEITDAGFVFDGESKALALPSDDHTKPADGTYSQRDEADQYILRFKKPANASAATKRPTLAQEAAIMKNWYGNTMIHTVRAGDKGVITKDGWIVGGVQKGLTPNGQRLRYSFLNPDYTYEEMGRPGDGPAPMQSGTWFWDAEGHNCELHQFPIDERQSVVCHVDVIPHEVGVVEGDPSYEAAVKNNVIGRPVEIVKGHVHLEVGL